MLEVIILSAIQGITEFLPISSSAHLVLVSQYFNFNNSSLTLDISLHFGSLAGNNVLILKRIFTILSEIKICF